MILTCEHDGIKLKEEQTKAGTIYKCPKCSCTYRLTIAVNNKDCWNKRFPPKELIKIKKERKKKSHN